MFAKKSDIVVAIPDTVTFDTLEKYFAIICGNRSIDRANIIGITPAWFRRSGRYVDVPP